MAEEGRRWGARASLAELVEAQHAAFAARYGEPPVETASAPGRINVIGGHTDYNQGLALPGAIDRWVVVTLSPRRDDAKRLHSEAFRETVVAPVLQPVTVAGGWSRIPWGAGSAVAPLIWCANRRRMTSSTGSPPSSSAASVMLPPPTFAAWLGVPAFTERMPRDRRSSRVALF